MNKKEYRYLHLSYDVKSLDIHFNNRFMEARKFILFVISSTFAKLVICPNKFTFLIGYEKDVDIVELMNYFDKNLNELFFYSISVVAEDRLKIPLLRDATDSALLEKLNKELKSVKRGRRTKIDV